MLSAPDAGWISFKLEGTSRYELSYLTDVPMLWLDAAIEGLEHRKPFCVTGALEPSRMVCVVSYWNCHVFVEYEDDFAMESGRTILEHSHTNMIDFCRMLHDDLSSDIDGFASFMYWASYDEEQKAAELRRKLDKLQALIESNAGYFDGKHAFF